MAGENWKFAFWPKRFSAIAVTLLVTVFSALLPREASQHFGDCLLPYIEDLLALSKGSGNVCSAISNAVICQQREMAPGFRYISNLRQATASKKVLVLGAGYVSAPVVDFLSSKNHELTLVSAIENEAAEMVKKYSFENVHPLTLNCLAEKEQLAQLVNDHDLVISLLPYVFHPQVAEIAIAQKKNMVTASYLSDGMIALNEQAKAAGITVVNEVGVDPGIDHMLAMELFHELEAKGEDIKSFVSFCGGLPAPEASSNALGYKFSWSPRGVLLNTISDAKWFHDSQVRQIAPGGEIVNQPIEFKSSGDEVPFTVWNGFALEGLPNRDSTKFKGQYGIDKCETLLRGTFRYSGYCSAVCDVQALKLIDESANAILAECDTWAQFLKRLTDFPGGDMEAFRAHLRKIKNGRGENVKVDELEKLGILSETAIENKTSPLDALAALLNGRMQYGKGERDAILMRHEVTTHQHPHTVHGVDFVYYGNQGSEDGKEYTAMAQTVGYPAAIAAHLVLQGKISEPGMLTPLTKEMYVPILAELKALGIEAKRTKSE